MVRSFYLVLVIFEVHFVAGDESYAVIVFLRCFRVIGFARYDFYSEMNVHHKNNVANRN